MRSHESQYYTFNFLSFCELFGQTFRLVMNSPNIVGVVDMDGSMHINNIFYCEEHEKCGDTMHHHGFLIYVRICQGISENKFKLERPDVL